MSAQVKHTPGDWAWSDAGVLVNDSGDTVIDRCPSTGLLWIANPADKPLIAAAPEMLALLQRHLTVIAQGDGIFWLENDIRALLARIEGAQS